MKFDSPLFDRIRVKRKTAEPASRAASTCEWPGCGNPGAHRAPKGRGREGEYWRYCLNHVREYNANYNYFAGLSDNDVISYQKDALTGHRPTWRMGMNASNRTGTPTGGAPRAGSSKGEGEGFTWHDPFGFFESVGAPGHKPREAEGRTIRNAERKAFETLGLEIDASAAEIKAKFKEQVKRHHPDTHGGDRSFEDRLRDVIQAYNYLKSAGFC